MKLPEQLHAQIKSAWSKIHRPLQFVIHLPDNTFQEDADFYKDASLLNDQLSWSEVPGEVFKVEIHLEGQPTGIAFQGIPMGHELTSFVLAPLVACEKAQMPDATTQARIKSLKGPIEVVSYISLSCENCPIVVQALNMMAALNPDIHHTMVDGARHPDLMKAKGILSVPSIYVNDQAFATGRQDFNQLLTKLEDSYSQSQTDTQDEQDYDVIVVGSGPAGSSAAIYTARKGLKTAIVTENVGGLVKETKGIENLISTPYIEGPQLAHNLQQHLNEYDIDIFENQSVTQLQSDTDKSLSLKGGLKLNYKALIAATGASWRKLQVPGEEEYMGRGVAFCPHCDGPFYKDKHIAVIGGGNSGVEAALDLANIGEKVTLLERGENLIADEVLKRKLFAHPKIEVLTQVETIEVIGDGQKVTQLHYRDLKTSENRHLDLAGIFIQIGLVPNSTWLEGHVETSPYGEVVIDERTQTSREGIYAAGDVSTVPYKQIVVAMGEGAKAGLSAFEYLLKQE